MARDYVTIREEERDGETVWTFTSVGPNRLKSAPAKVTKQGDEYQIMGAAWGDPIAGVEVQIDEERWQAGDADRGRGGGVRLDLLDAGLGYPVLGRAHHHLARDCRRWRGPASPR